jgi:hypothetical protein
VETTVPRARAHGSFIARARAFALTGPKQATTGVTEWIASLAWAVLVASVGFFLVCTLVQAIRAGFGQGDQVKLVVLGAMAAAMLGGVQWVMTLAGGGLLSLLGWPVSRMPMRPAAVLGAVIVATGLVFVEYAAAAPWRLMEGVIPMPRMVSVPGLIAIGGLWGAWLPRAWTATLAARAAARKQREDEATQRLMNAQRMSITPELYAAAIKAASDAMSKKSP